MSLIWLFLNKASETSRLIPVWEVKFQTIAPRYLMLVLQVVYRSTAQFRHWAAVIANWGTLFVEQVNTLHICHHINLQSQ